uniref:HECT-type E3 ubiquitin transferase n=1 Tax=Mesocestoides corti TaxID=53468 RepID=A0A5K3FLW4_MESCO
MFSFDGQYGSKRRPLYVQVGPKNLIQKAQEERKQRARRNLEQKAATLIQSFIRGAMSRRKTNDYLRQTFNQLAEQLLALEEDRSCDPLCINSLCTCLRAFRIFSEKGVSDDDAAVVAKVLLSPTCQTAYSQWINTNEKSILNTITQIIIRLLCYLRNLPPAAPSRLYVLPVRVLEALLRSEASRSSEQASACLLQISLNLCKFGLYYFSLAVFIDRQSLEADCDNLLEDFLRQPKNQALADLLKLPFEHCLPKDLSEGKLSTMTQEFLSSALNDVTAAARLEASGNQSTASKIPRLVFPILLNAIPRELLIGQLYASAVGDATDDVQGPAARRLQPSLTLLHRFICGIVPGLLSASPSFQPTPSQTDASEQAVDEEQAELLMQQQQLWATPQASSAADADATDSSLVLAVLRILAWMFTSMMSARCPADGGAATTAAVTAKFSPPFPLLSLRSSGNTADDTDSDDDGGGGGGNVGEAVDQSPGTADAFVDEASLRFTNVWPTQTAEVFASLQKYLPSLAGIALRELYNSQVSRHPQRQEIVLCLCTLHSMLSFVKSASASSMIPLNSVLSQFPEFLRDLWDLTQNLLSSKTDDQWHSDIKFFDLIASGEIKRMPRNIDQYTAIVLTFVDCLRHRLLCLTDVEINASEEMPSRTPSSPCGFAPAELLLMGARLRDLMIGLIHLTYPSRRPERRGAHDNDDDNDTVLKIREIISRVGEQRLHGRRALALAYTAFSTDEVLRLRWLLRRWTTLFTHTQALVTLIYDWDHRRQSREAVNLTRRSQNDPGRSIWLKPGAVPAFSLDSLPVWLRGGDGMVALAGLPFGYYGCLNVDQSE